MMITTILRHVYVKLISIYVFDHLVTAVLLLVVDICTKSFCHHNMLYNSVQTVTQMQAMLECCGTKFQMYLWRYCRKHYLHHSLNCIYMYICKMLWNVLGSHAHTIISDFFYCRIYRVSIHFSQTHTNKKYFICLLSLLKFSISYVINWYDLINGERYKNCNIQSYVLSHFVVMLN